MFHRFAGALFALAVLAACPDRGRAHEDHDQAVPASQMAGTGLRAEAASERFELVAVPRGDRLVLYLDRFSSNEPVSGAHIDVETPEGTVEASQHAEGIYGLRAAWLARGGHDDLVIRISADGKTDVLTLDLDHPDAVTKPAVSGSDGPSLLRGLREHLRRPPPIAAAACGFLFGLATLGLARSGRRLPALAVLAASLALLLGGTALAHEDDADAGEHAQAVNGAALLDPAIAPNERARRLPGGAVYVPKATQRLLDLRTALVSRAKHRRSIELPGRIIADPNASGVVQSSVGGRLSAGPSGFPDLGARVRRGDVLATVTPPVQAVDASDMRQTQGDLDQQIAIVARRVARYQRLAASGAVAQTALDDARAELSGLEDRRTALDAMRREPEDLVAPVDGVVAERSATAGQMASPGTMVFRIVDPKRLYVEALSFEAVDPGAEAGARLPDGTILSLSYRGEGLADRNQAVPVQFAIRDAAASVRLGQFVTVVAPRRGATTGLALPRAGVIRSEAGTTVYEHVSAERFEARAVRIEPLDADRVVVSAGLDAGRRVVIQGADLLEQVR